MVLEDDPLLKTRPGLLATLWALFLSPFSTLFLLSFQPPTLNKRKKKIEGKGKRSLNKVRGQKGDDVIVRLLPVDWGIKLLGAK